MTVYRDWLPADEFTIIPNHWLRDPRLSLKAKGLIAYVASHQNGYELSIKQIVAETSDGKSAIYAGLKELVDLHYLTTNRARDDAGKLGETDYRFGPAAYERQYARAWGISAGQDHIRKSERGLHLRERQDPKATSENLNVDLTCEDTEFPQVETKLRFSRRGKSDTKKNSSLEDQFQEDKTPPTPHADAADTAPVPAATEGDGSFARKTPTQTQTQERSESEGQLVLRDICHQMPPRLIPINGNRARLLVLANRALSAGWSRQALVDRIGGNGLEALDNPGRVFGMLRYRLEHVGTPEDYRPVPSRPLVAGRTRHHRYVEDMAGYDQCAVCGMGRGNFRHSEDAPEIVPAEMEPGIVGDVSAEPNEAAVRSLVGAFRGLSM